MATISQDLRYAIRRITDTPLFTLAAIATLAIGLGVTSAVLSLANTIFFKPLQLSEPDRLVLIDGRRQDRPPVYAFGLSHPDYRYFRDHARSFESLAAHYPTSPLHVSRAAGGFEVLGSVVTDAPVIVPGALVPVLCDPVHDVATYIEPTVWFRHDVGGRFIDDGAG